MRFLKVVCAIFLLFPFVSFAQITPTTTCTFTRNLSLGTKGSDVLALQKVLNKSSDTQIAATGAGSPGQETTYFGLGTYRALIKYQQKYADTILKPAGLTKGSGYFGLNSRLQASQTCSVTSAQNAAPNLITTTNTIASATTTDASVLPPTCPAPVINTPSVITATVGSALTLGITSTSIAAPTYTVGGLPSGLSFNGNVITGTPTIAGSYALTITARSACGISTKNSTLTIASSIVYEPIAPAKKFSIADFHGAPGIGSFTVLEANITSNQSKSTLTFSKTSEQQVNDSTLIQQWSTPNNEVKAQATLKKIGEDAQMDITVTAGSNITVDLVKLRSAWILSSSSPTRKIYSAFKAGRVYDWPQDGYAHQISSLWPGTAYSPLAAFYDTSTSEGIGFIAFDRGLHQTSIHWVTGGDRIDPLADWYANIAPNASASITMYLHHDVNMPTSHFAFYRNNFLVPFMQSQGVSEGQFHVDGVLSYNFYPDNSDVSASVKKVVGLGAKGFLQYAPGDGIDYFEPNPQTLAWYPTLKAASQVSGNTALGVLINPFYCSRQTPPTSDRSSTSWFPGPRCEDLSLKDPNVAAWFDRLKNDVAAQGVNYAFWDTGTNPKLGEEMEWFNVLKSWKQAGISIAAESSGDINAYISGTTMLVPYDSVPVDPLLSKTVTPQAQLSFLGGIFYKATTPFWWDDAKSRGFLPLIEDAWLPLYAKEYGFQ